jgi:hypothetical protein
MTVSSREQLKRAVLLQTPAATRRRGRRARPARRERVDARAAPADRTGRCRCRGRNSGLWFLDQLDPAAGLAYHMPAALRLRGALDRAALRAALDRLVAATRCCARASRASTASRCRSSPPPTPASRWRTSTHRRSRVRAHAAREAAALARIEAEAARPFDLARGPLIRGLLLRLGAEDHVLLIVKHPRHLGRLVDRRARARELGALYAAFSRRCAGSRCRRSRSSTPTTPPGSAGLQGETLAAPGRLLARTLCRRPALLSCPPTAAARRCSATTAASCRFALSARAHRGPARSAERTARRCS